MTSSVKENEAEMINLSTTGDERTVDHEAKLKLSIQEIACLVEDDTGNIAGDHESDDGIDFSNIDIRYDDGDSNKHSLPTPPYNSDTPDEENLIIDVINPETVKTTHTHSVNENENETIPISSDINTKIQLLEDEVINRRRARNRSWILSFCKTCIFYIFLLYLFFIPNMVIIFMYHDDLLRIFDNSHGSKSY